jgi:DNA N-6-adenine-methyltransferase Dam
MALHEQCVGQTDEWYTPAHVFNALGCSFDMDVASPGSVVTPWIPAKTFISADGMAASWRGFVWMNPPFGGRNGLVPWLHKFFEHRNGIALTPDRTSAPWWQQFAPRAEMILFVSPKLKFIGADGKPGDSPAQGTCLMAAGRTGCDALYRAASRGLGFLMRSAAVGCQNWAGQCTFHCGLDACSPRPLHPVSGPGAPDAS